MTYLARLALKATGLAQGVRPRVRSRFEPVRAAEPAELALEREVVRSSMPEGASPQAAAGRPSLPPAGEHEPVRRDRAGAMNASPRSAGEAAGERIVEVPRPMIATTTTLIAERTPAPSRESPIARRFAPAQPIADLPSASPPPLLSEPPLAFGGAIRARQGEMDSAPPHDRDGANPTDRPSGVDSGVRHVHVTIGRVEVRAVVPETGARQPTAPKRPTPLSLEEYLRRRGPP